MTNAIWNGVSGRAWVDAQQVLDAIFAPIEDLLVGGVRAGQRVLDVGCGAGSTTVGVARVVGVEGTAVGIDISEPLIAAAMARAERERVPARFVRADAQTYAFEADYFDMIISRFGVMFFDDFVAAFSNLRRAVRNGGELRLVTWRSPEENPFMTTAERAAAPLVNIPARETDAPGQFALANPPRICRILEESGWVEIDIRPIDVDCALPEAELLRYVTRLGPLGRALAEVDDRTRDEVIEIVRPAFDPYVHGAHVRFTAAVWTIRASSRS